MQIRRFDMPSIRSTIIRCNATCCFGHRAIRRIALGVFRTWGGRAAVTRDDSALLISVRAWRPALQVKKFMDYNAVPQLLDAPGAAIALPAKLVGTPRRGRGTPDGRAP